MTWAHWVLYVLLPAWAALLWWIARGPIGDGDIRLEQPVREACELSDDEEAAWQRIRAGAGQ